jgi:hypothetical protein
LKTAQAVLVKTHFGLFIVIDFCYFA